MLLSEKKVWKIVTSEHLRPKSVEEHEAELEENSEARLTNAGRRTIQREIE